MEWTVVTVITALVGLFFTVGKPITKLVTEVKALRIDTTYQQKELDQEDKILKELVKIVANHETDLQKQEVDMSELRAQTAEMLKITMSHESRITRLEDHYERMENRQ